MQFTLVDNMVQIGRGRGRGRGMRSRRPRPCAFIGRPCPLKINSWGLRDEDDSSSSDSSTQSPGVLPIEFANLILVIKTECANQIINAERNMGRNGKQIIL